MESNSKTPSEAWLTLMGAIQCDRLALAEQAIKAGADVNFRRDKCDPRPLERAASFGHTKIVELLLKAGADPNLTDALGETPMHMAARHGHIETARALKDGGGRLDREDQLHMTPHELAAYVGQVDTFAELKQWTENERLARYKHSLTPAVRKR